MNWIRLLKHMHKNGICDVDESEALKIMDTWDKWIFDIELKEQANRFLKREDFGW